MDESHVVTKAAAEAAHVVADAADTAKAMMAQAGKTADDNTTKLLADALRQVFGENVAQQRFVDVSRIPLICKSILDMHANIGEIKTMMREERKGLVNQDQFYPVRNIVYGIMGLLGAATMAAIFKLIFKWDTKYST